MSMSLDPSLSPAAIAWPASRAQDAADEIAARIRAGGRSLISDACAIAADDAVRGLLFLIPTGSRYEARSVVVAEIVDRARLRLAPLALDDLEATIARAREALERAVPSVH